MRCTECGFSNDASAKICIKCGTKLTASVDAPQKPDAPKGGNPTIKGGQSDQPYWDAPGVSESVGEKSSKSTQKCEKCGHYPLVYDSKRNLTCPNCGFGIQTEFQKEPISSKSPKTMPLSKINLAAGKGFKLTEIQSGKTLSFKEDRVTLNRGNVDSENPTISANLHAEIYFENGSWKITDQSSNHATFIQVNGAMSIPNGATLMIGNKFFLFESE